MITEAQTNNKANDRRYECVSEYKERLLHLLDNAIVGFFQIDINGHFVLVNLKFAQIFGFNTLNDFFNSVPNVAKLFLNSRDLRSIAYNLRRWGYVDGAELPFKKRDGQIIWAVIRVMSVNSKSGEEIYEGFTADVTERRLIEHERHQSEKRFRMLVEQAGDAFFIHDYEGKILDVNKRACQSLGYTRDELLGMKISDVDLDANTKQHKKMFWQQLEPEEYITFGGTHKRKDGTTFPVEVRLGRLDLENQSVILSLMRDVTERKKAEQELKNAFNEIKELKKRLEDENFYLRQEVEIRYRHEEIVGESKEIKKVLSDAEKVAKENTPVLILGETGTGKELLARAVHRMSPRKKKAMIKVNCAALPSTLIESELFGREKGAFTGAVSKQIGRFEAADGSTIFLDEIGDLPCELQSKLLRVLQENKFERLGSSETRSVDVRVIAATNHNLAELVKQNNFRKDLFYRLNVFPLKLPPLREREGGIEQLTWAFVEEFNQSMGKSVQHIPKKTMDMLKNYNWPGNIRELKNVIEKAMIMTNDSVLRIDRLETDEMTDDSTLKLEDVEREHIKRVMKRTGWKISGKNGAAPLMGLNESTLRSKMKKLGIRRPA
ncbi:MAG: sigma 54-interacting transcriptional regulator [Desulfobacteraceae bacterium]|nr:sigma 54-interacting transcriptional regulator [Desulfobacteraceae bacterium]